MVNIHNGPAEWLFVILLMKYIFFVIILTMLSDCFLHLCIMSYVGIHIGFVFSFFAKFSSLTSLFSGILCMMLLR